MELSNFDAKIHKMSELVDKMYNYLKRFTDAVIPLVESVNGMLVIFLKEEKEKKYNINFLISYS